MAIKSYPLFGDDPDPTRHGICDKCGALIGDPTDNFCDDCWDMNQVGERFSAPE